MRVGTFKTLAQTYLLGEKGFEELGPGAWEGSTGLWTSTRASGMWESGTLARASEWGLGKLGTFAWVGDKKLQPGWVCALFVDFTIARAGGKGDLGNLDPASGRWTCDCQPARIGGRTRGLWDIKPSS